MTRRALDSIVSAAMLPAYVIFGAGAVGAAIYIGGVLTVATAAVTVGRAARAVVRAGAMR